MCFCDGDFKTLPCTFILYTTFRDISSEFRLTSFTLKAIFKTSKIGPQPWRATNVGHLSNLLSQTYIMKNKVNNNVQKYF